MVTVASSGLHACLCEVRDAGNAEAAFDYLTRACPVVGRYDTGSVERYVYSPTSQLPASITGNTTSHDRWFLVRIATHMLAFEGDSHVEWFEGNYEDYEKVYVVELFRTLNALG
jgi:hypothetical protein